MADARMKRFIIIFFLFQYALLLTMYGIFAQPNQERIAQSNSTIVKSSSAHNDSETRKLEDLLAACEEDEDGDESVSARKHSLLGNSYFLVSHDDLMLVNFYQHIKKFFCSRSFSQLANLELHILFRTFLL